VRHPRPHPGTWDAARTVACSAGRSGVARGGAGRPRASAGSGDLCGGDGGGDGGGGFKVA